MVDAISSIAAVVQTTYRYGMSSSAKPISHISAPFAGQNDDQINISPVVDEKSIDQVQTTLPGDQSKEGDEVPGKQEDKNKTSGGTGESGDLSHDQQAAVDKLGAMDREVRAHEQAHMAAGGSLITHGAMYSYQTGPDGKRYAVSGEVQIDVSPVNDDPKATIAKSQRIIRAALAPADPSPQDRQVAAEASSMLFKAMRELAKAAYGGSNTSQTSSTSITA